MLRSSIYQEKLVCVAVDEAHCGKTMGGAISISF